MGAYRTDFAKDNDLYVQDSSGTKREFVTSTGGLLQNGAVPLSYIETITYTSVGLSVSTATAYGVTFIDSDSTGGVSSSSPATLTLAAPITGVKKTIIFDTTLASTNSLDIALSGATIIGTSGDSYILFSSLAEVTQSITLIGITTALWGVESVNSTLLFYGAATGIRGATAARTS